MTQTAQALSTPPSEVDAGPTRFDFFGLPRPVQDRFIASASGAGVPQPLMFCAAQSLSSYRWRVLRWLLLVAGSLVVFALSSALGFGELDHPLAIQPVVMGLVYALSAAAAAVGLAGYMWARSRHRRFPYPLGIYYFPIGVIVAMDGALEVYPLRTMQALEPERARRVRVNFSTRQFAFTLPEGVTIDQLREQAERDVARFNEAYAAKNRRALAALDPLRDSGFSNPLSSRSQLTRPSDWRPLRFGLAIALGTTVGVLFFLARNKLAEQTLYKQAVNTDTVEAYRAYLERGGQRADVEQVLLPRAELKAARGDLDRVEAYAAAHPNSQIRPEIEQALREELLVELQKVEQASTLEALEAFKREHPAHAMIASELTRARHQLFEQALTRFVEEYQPDESVRQMFEKLLAYSETHGPLVRVSFRRQLSPRTSTIDNAIRRSGYYMGTKSVPSQYFEAEHAEPRERESVAQLTRRLQSAFSPDILRFVEGDYEQDGGELPRVQSPTLLISYTVTMSGGYTTNRPRGVYVGLGMMIQSDVLLPESGSVFEFKDSSWLPPDINEISREVLMPVDVYDRNAREGLRRFRGRLLKRLLGDAAGSPE